SLLIGDKCGAHTVPYIEAKNASAVFEHEATTSKISDDQMFYCQQRGIGPEEAVALIVNGFCKEVLQQLPMEFAVEAQKLVGISLEGSVGWPRIRERTACLKSETCTSPSRAGKSSRVSTCLSAPARSTPSWDRTVRARAPCPTSWLAAAATMSPRGRSGSRVRISWTWNRKSGLPRACF